jgi:hypothetical protein
VIDELTAGEPVPKQVFLVQVTFGVDWVWQFALSLLD